MSQHIHWYPGHIAKAQRELKEKISLVDVVIEIIDARIPYSSKYKNVQSLCLNKPRLILMNKTDLSDDKYDKIWADIISKIEKCDVFTTNLKNKNDVEKIYKKITFLANDIMQKRISKGMLPRPVRTMVVGLPNTGKSSTINKLVGRSKAKTGAKAGVTRSQQWVRINDKIELLDTPGIIPTVQDDQKQAINLAYVNSVGENAYDSEFVASNLLKILFNYYKNELLSYYNLDTEPALENIALNKKWLLKQEKPDLKRTAQMVLSAFREGRIGKFTLERPEEFGLI